MAIALRAVSVGPNSNATSSAITLPAGTTTGDVTIIAFTRGANYGDASPTNVTVPVGWTTLCNANGQGACYRVWQSGDPASVTLTSTITNWWESVAATYSGCDTSAPIDATNFCVSASSGAGGPFNDLYYAPSVNPTWQNDQLLAIYMNSNTSSAGTFTPPGGFTQQAISTAGPNVVIADRVLGTANTPTGAAKATWQTTAGFVHAGIQVALKTAGAASVTPAAPNTVWGSAIGFYGLSGGTVPVPLSKVLPQAGDLVAIFATVAAGTIGTPSGYVQSALINGNYLFTRTFQAGDADPALVTGSTTILTAVCLRKSGTGGANPTIDQAVTAAGTGGASPFSATTPSLTPANSTEYMLAAWMVFGTNSATFTPPGGLTAQTNAGPGPGILLMDTYPAATPTGTFTAQAATTSAVSTYGAIELLVSTGGSGGGGGAAVQARALVLA